ncbi:MAG: TlpA family protein disulfide reductase [Prevotellaceae bacterium]|nr:TlpA family protein disulfide reductase [Prevotellaceae bacterium]
MLHFEFKVNEFGLDKMYIYLRHSYPESEYLQQITKKFKPKNMPNIKEEGSAISFISKEVSSLSALSAVPSLKGKYLFVDLWATWCIPCREEFGKKEALHKISQPYKNVERVYISIDDDSRAEQWKNDIDEWRLCGYNIRANNRLVADIKEKVYSSEHISIPRYLLISPSGEILDGNLPRLSQSKLLEQTIHQLIK